MVKSLIKLALVLIVGILLYNYFLGDPSEKENAKQVFEKVKEVGDAVVDLVKSEKEKFDAGKYDDVFDKIGGAIQDLKRQAKDIDENYVDRLTRLDKKRKELEERLQKLTQGDQPDTYDKLDEKAESERDKIDRELEELNKEFQRINEEINRKNESGQ